MSTDDPGCTCKNRRLSLSEAMLWIGPKGDKWATARDCPVHGMRVLEDVHQNDEAESQALDSVTEND